MTTELSKLQIENPPKEQKNDGGELIHGKGLSKVARPEEIKGAGHAAAGARMVKNKRKDARQGDGADMETSQMGKGISSRQGSEADAHQLFAGHDDVAKGQTESPASSVETITCGWRL